MLKCQRCSACNEETLTDSILLYVLFPVITVAALVSFDISNKRLLYNVYCIVLQETMLDKKI